MSQPPIAIIILDGFGIGEADEHNAIYLADTPTIDELLETCSNSEVSTSGEDVGLPEGQVGNSEVGHMNLGAGRVIYQQLTDIMDQISDGRFFFNRVYNEAMNHCTEQGTSLHLMGLLSDGGVHSHIEILYALMELAKNKGLERVYIHAFLDGRDVGQTTGLEHLRHCAEKCAELDIGKIATVMGRFFVLDRDNRWARVERAYRAMVHGEGRFVEDPVAAVEERYCSGQTDEFIRPMICDKEGMIRENDAVIFFNFRPDRAREITAALTDENFSGFERPLGNLKTHYVCTSQYDKRFTWTHTAFPPKNIVNTFGEYISRLGYTQLRLAETEKYAHVTFFLDGGVECVYEGETQKLIPSPKTFPTYDMVPEMSANEVADAAVEYIEAGEHDVIIMNFANCDMVGHTGDLEAAIIATETVDECLGRVVTAMDEQNGVCVILADHGNAEQMCYLPDETPHTSHTTNLVPLIITGQNLKLRSGALCDVVPTVLEIMGVEKPREMTGRSLILH